MLKQCLRMVSQSVLVAVGVVIGILIAPRIERSVEARQTGSVPHQSASPAPIENHPSQEPGAPRMIVLQSYATSGAMGTNVLLVHNLQADIAVVNGYDIMKINQQIINYLASLPVGDQRALAAIVRNSRAEEIYQIPTAQPSK